MCGHVSFIKLGLSLLVKSVVVQKKILNIFLTLFPMFFCVYINIYIFLLDSDMSNINMILHKVTRRIAYRANQSQYYHCRDKRCALQLVI